ncbi:MAG: hypothetical protein M3456_04800 [Actinomycetota bacterium]|nr:hypothetical protein [Actinomycetota bacterium]
MRTAPRLVWVALGAITLVVLASQAFSVAAGVGADPTAVIILAFPIVGALIASRQPRSAIGWIMLAVGVEEAVSDGLYIYAEYSLAIHPGSLPRPDLALALGAPTWVPFIGLMGTFLILLFPDGHLPSPRWRPWAWFCAFALTLSFIFILIAPLSFPDQGYPKLRNPLGIEALRPYVDALFLILLLIPISIVGCAAGLIQRFRRSRGQDRLQLKWLAAGAGATATLYLIAMVPSLALASQMEAEPVWLRALTQISFYSFVLIPVAVGIAILRHRLYDIDLIINRTLVYGALTAALTVAYVLGVTVLQALLRPFAGQSQLAVAGSTLTVAALFRPGRARIQTFIDRRFYRRKYDAGRTLEVFSAKLRDEVDLDTLGVELVALVDEVMRPNHVSVWLREASGLEADPAPEAPVSLP